MACNTIFASFIVSDNAIKTHKTICVVLFISFECAGVNGFINSALAVCGIHVCNKQKCQAFKLSPFCYTKWADL